MAVPQNVQDEFNVTLTQYCDEITAALDKRFGLDKVAKYSDDQERDDHGRWTSGGGSVDEHKEAMDRYKEHAAINEWLRGDRSPAAGSDKENKALRDKVDAAIAAQTTSEPMSLYRGFGDANVFDLANKRGEFTDKAYVSGTTDKSVVKDFAGNGYIARIDVPTGSHAYSFGKDDPQKEVVLPRGSRFKIVGIYHDEKMVSMRLVK